MQMCPLYSKSSRSWTHRLLSRGSCFFNI
jgi:hypothetical protein